MHLEMGNKMEKKLKKFTICTNVIKDPKLEIAENVRNTILTNVAGAEAKLCKMEECASYDFSNTECVIVLGGDGTLLRVAKEIRMLELPLLGINLGTLGFLAEVELAGVEEAVKRLAAGDYHVEERMMLDGVVDNEDGDTCVITALNDIVLSRRLDLQLIGYRVYVNGVFLSDFYGDGVILSSPTGSTGYNMSAGGSIVEPKAKLIVLTAVSPHTMNNRSVMLSPEDIVEVEILPPKGTKAVEVGVYFDGDDARILHPGDRVRISSSPLVTKVLKLSDVGFLEVLRNKMN